MSFEATLQEMVDECPGALGIALMGSDGIPVAQAQGAARDAGELAEDVAAAGVEFGRILDDMRKASDGIGGGRLDESFVGLDNYWLLFRVVDDEFFLVAVLTPTGNLGKARYLMRRHLAKLQSQL